MNVRITETVIASYGNLSLPSNTAWWLGIRPVRTPSRQEEFAVVIEVALNDFDTQNMIDAQNPIRWLRNQAIEPHRQPMILSPNHKLCQQIRNHLFGDAEMHNHVAKTDVTPNQVVAYLQMSYIPKLRCVCRDVKTSHRVGVEPIWLRAGEPQEAKHIFGME